MSDFENDIIKTSLFILGNELEAAENQEIPRNKAISALHAVIAFLNSIPEWQNENPALTLVQLCAALNDLDVGRVGEIVAPAEGFDNRKPEGSFLKVKKAFAIFAVDKLKAAGLKNEEAYKFVAKIFEELTIPIRGHRNTETWKTIKGWREGVSKLAPNDQQKHTLEALRSLDQPEPRKAETIEMMKIQLSSLLRLILTRI